jgi:hypothetical protein
MHFIKNSLCLLGRYAKLNVHVGNDSASPSLSWQSNALPITWLTDNILPIRIRCTSSARTSPPTAESARIEALLSTVMRGNAVKLAQTA